VVFVVRVVSVVFLWCLRLVSVVLLFYYTDILTLFNPPPTVLLFRDSFSVSLSLCLCLCMPLCLWLYITVPYP
jgi:hypothetical protein